MIHGSVDAIQRIDNEEDGDAEEQDSTQNTASGHREALELIDA